MFKYRVETVEDFEYQIENKCNEMAKAGWRLVTMYQVPSKVYGASVRLTFEKTVRDAS